MVELQFDRATSSTTLPLELRSGRRIFRPDSDMQTERINSAAGSNPGGPPTPYWTISSRPRDPPDFTGLRGDDLEDWLDTYNRVSAFNRRDDSFKLINVGWSLHKVAKTWFLNNEAKLTT